MLTPAFPAMSRMLVREIPLSTKQAIAASIRSFRRASEAISRLPFSLLILTCPRNASDTNERSLIVWYHSHFAEETLNGNRNHMMHVTKAKQTVMKMHL